MSRAQKLLEAAWISPAIFELRPDYRALLMVVENIPPSSGDNTSESILASAEASVKEQLSTTPITQLPHIVAWREAYKAFGIKPAKYRNSLEALTRRAEGGLPRVNRLTDIYNAISIKHQIPLGGEDLDRYEGMPFLIRATGKEPFVTSSGGEPVVENAAEGEPVWCDEAGVTCRRWNWRQGPRTALHEGSKDVLFIFDALEPISDDALVQAAEELASLLTQASSEVKTSFRILRAPASG